MQATVPGNRRHFHIRFNEKSCRVSDPLEGEFFSQAAPCDTAELRMQLTLRQRHFSGNFLSGDIFTEVLLDQLQRKGHRFVFNRQGVCALPWCQAARGDERQRRLIPTTGQETIEYRGGAVTNTFHVVIYT